MVQEPLREDAGCVDRRRVRDELGELVHLEPYESQPWPPSQDAEMDQHYGPRGPGTRTGSQG